MFVVVYYVPMRAFSGFFYWVVIKPILFLFPADHVHALFLTAGKRLGQFRFFRWLLRAMWSFQDATLEQSVVGLDFKNPVGLSAGFDYNADLVELLPSIGFGFHTIGTLTFESYEGNPAPMLGRLPRSRSLLVNKGFKNEGVGKVLSQVPPIRSTARRGVSIGVTNKAYGTYDEMLQNLIAGFKAAESFDTFDYYELNISCPNLRNVKQLTEQLASPEGLRKALELIARLMLKRPLFIKMLLERSLEEMDALVKIAAPFSFVRGLIFSNLVKDRTNKTFDQEEIRNAGAGNFSGKPVEE
jgi:dihydroorotate dehydrogenase